MSYQGITGLLRQNNGYITGEIIIRLYNPLALEKMQPCRGTNAGRQLGAKSEVRNRNWRPTNVSVVLLRVVQKERMMKTMISCLSLILVAGCSGLRPEPASPPGTVHIDIEEGRGISIVADSVRFEDLVRVVVEKMIEFEQPKVTPTISMSRDLADRRVSINLQNEMSRSKIFTALEEAGNCTMVVSDDDNDVTFKEK